jgi:23S rRNA C2498 (ribose-2'-O)-methylase RlmM
VCEELALRLQMAEEKLQTAVMALQGEGFVGVPAPAPAALRALPARPLIFERQRLPAARRLDLANLDALAGKIAESELTALNPGTPWTVHAFAANPNAPKSLAGWAARLEERLRQTLAATAPSLLNALRPPADVTAAGKGVVLQLCAVPQALWVGLSPREALSSPHPGGVHVAPSDPLAPSRSFMKVEEALELMPSPPRPRERVVDLGAAPGGWSHAFLKRGCRVLAVDNGPMKIRSLDALPGELTHVRANGMTFRPPPAWLPADWLLADMLIPPGQCLGLLKRWLSAGWARRFIVNIKLPQRDPLVALRPIETFLTNQPGVGFVLRQLYHDRREVTVLGEAKAAKATPRRPKRSRGP